MKTLRRVLASLLCFAVLTFAVSEGIVLAGCRSETGQDAHVMIILGAMVWPDGPSPALVRRMDLAIDYLDDHPDTLVIVSGGQGTDEFESEAQSMQDYLTAHGVAEDCIVQESESTDTLENLQYSAQLMNSLGYDTAATPVVVVSNSFHLSRVRLLCGRCGLNADTLGAPMPNLKSALYSYNREAFALIKSFLLDRPDS